MNDLTNIIDTIFELALLYMILRSFFTPLINALQFRIKNPKVADVLNGADKVALGIVNAKLQFNPLFGADQKRKATKELVDRINSHVGRNVLTEKTASERIELAYQKLSDKTKK